LLVAVIALVVLVHGAEITIMRLQYQLLLGMPALAAVPANVRDSQFNST